MSEHQCKCNCHDPKWCEATGQEEHSDCGLCFIALFEEEQRFNESYHWIDSFMHSGGQRPYQRSLM